MFTGLIDHCGVLKTVSKKSETYKLSIETQFDDLVIGESVCVDGVCLTVTAFDGKVFHCEVSPETRKLTVVEQYQPGAQVNLERALRLSDRLGGHFVTGHVDQTAWIKEKNLIGDYVEVSIEMSEGSYDNQNFLIGKGCVAVNGVSLTINDVSDMGFKLMLIPHTLIKTNLSHLSAGDRVNIEFDWLAKIVHVQLNQEHICQYRLQRLKKPLTT